MKPRLVKIFARRHVEREHFAAANRGERKEYATEHTLCYFPEIHSDSALHGSPRSSVRVFRGHLPLRRQAGESLALDPRRIHQAVHRRALLELPQLALLSQARLLRVLKRLAKCREMLLRFRYRSLRMNAGSHPK
jgi:hypothetical protein